MWEFIQEQLRKMYYYKINYSLIYNIWILGTLSEV